MALIADIVQIFRNYRVQDRGAGGLGAHPIHVVKAAKLGAHVATLPPAVLRQLFNHPLTDKGLATVPGRLGEDRASRSPERRMTPLRRRAGNSSSVPARQSGLAGRAPRALSRAGAAGAGARRGAGRPHGGDAAGASGRERATGLLAAGRAAAGLAGRVQDAVLALIRAPDPADCVSGEMPGILGVDAAASVHGGATIPGLGWLPPGKVGALLDGRDVVFRDAPADAPLLHAEAAGLARHDALVRVPGAGPPALLALVTRDSARWIRRRGRARWPSSAAPSPPRSGDERDGQVKSGHLRAGSAGGHMGSAPRALDPQHWPARKPGGFPRLARRRAPRRGADGGGLWRRSRGVPGLPDPASGRRAGSGGTGGAAPSRLARLAGAYAADGAGNATRARHLSAVRSFFRFLARRHGVDNPALALSRPPRAKPPVPRALAPTRPARSPTTSPRCPTAPRVQARDTALFTLLYGCGLRIAEALALNVRDAPLPGGDGDAARGRQGRQGAHRAGAAGGARGDRRVAARCIPIRQPAARCSSARAAGGWIRRWRNGCCGSSAG